MAFLRLRCERIGFLSRYRRLLSRHPAPPLRGEIQSATCVDSPHRARSPHVVPCIHLCSLLAAATERRVEARLERCGLPPLVATSWACAISPTPVCFTRTEPTPQKKAGSSWIANAIDACCVSARTALRVSAPVAMAAANGARPAASVRLCCCRLDRGHTTCLHLAAWVALFAHASVLLAWLRQRHQARRIGSLFVQAPSSGRHAPCRGWGRRASPRSTSAAMAAPTVSAAPRRLAFHSLPFYQGGVLSRRPPLCKPFGYCLRQTPPVPPTGYRLSYGCRFRQRLPLHRRRAFLPCRQRHPVPPLSA